MLPKDEGLASAATIIQGSLDKDLDTYVNVNNHSIGDITVTPYWMDHSAFDAYAFMIESQGKSLFYSGDFRSHGRKSRAFRWFTHNAPKNVDYLLLEGTLRKS